MIRHVVDCPSLVLLIDRCGSGRMRIGFGSRFELDRGAQLADRGDLGQRGVMLIRTLAGPLGDHADLIQRQPALPQALHTAGKLRRAGARQQRWCARSPKKNRSSTPPTPPPTAPR